MDSYDIKDISLAKAGSERIEWAEKDMPVLRKIRQRFEKTKPLQGLIIGACLHVTTETANLAITLKKGGAKLFLCASNPLSTQDDVAASLVKHHKISVFAIKGEDNKIYYSHINRVIDAKPDITMDDGADLVSTIHTKRKNCLKNIIGGTEETTTGVIRLKAMAKDHELKYPIIAVNDAMTKHFFDNRYGTGQSTIDGIVRATNRLIAGSTFVMAGYGWCGRGIANKARGSGANVIVTEVDPVKALEAKLDGFRVMKMIDAAKQADFVCTSTGDINVVDKQHFKVMKNECILCNSGHFNVEINIEALENLAKSKKELKNFVSEYNLGNKRIYLLAGGRLINLSAAEGHPACVMDMSFANQALSAEYLVENASNLEPDVFTISEKIDKEIASIKLDEMGVEIDKLTKEQKKYLESWSLGT
ncbi:adenosylhomocysteinase [Candidatus Dojkabacteria bacterium]|nr:adenosylhomocysteinase [Candidatus Dojkabacteria bacterium]